MLQHRIKSSIPDRAVIQLHMNLHMNLHLNMYLHRILPKPPLGCSACMIQALLLSRRQTVGPRSFFSGLRTVVYVCIEIFLTI